MLGMPTTGNIYSLRDLTHSYGKYPTLDIASLDVTEGGVVGLIGPNGSGKSTLLKVLGLLQPRRSGDLFYRGERIDGREQALRREITLLLQEPYLLRRTVYANIAYPLKLRGMSAAEIEVTAADSLRRVGLRLDDFGSRPWYRLSGGEVQRVSLAVRLALRPKVLLLDEPTANVDEASATRIKEAVWHAWSDWGTTIVVATHDLIWLYEVATKIVSLYRGRAISDGAENLIQGDWLREEGRAAIRLRGQQIVARLPDDLTAALECAALNPSDIKIVDAASAAPAGCNRLLGTIAQMSVERATGEILSVVDCDGISLRARFPADFARSSNLYPGLHVALIFSEAALSFI